MALGAERPTVIFERLAIQADDDVLTLELHPRLTVVGAVGHVEREAMVNEFVGALASSRDGVHLELTADSGRQLAVFRPFGAEHRVVDVTSATDATAEFISAEGNVDLLATLGLDQRSARNAMRVTASDLMTATERDHLVHRLSRANQMELWAAANSLSAAAARLDEEAEAVGSNAADAEVIERIDARHNEFEARQLQFERRRRGAFIVAGITALGIIPAAGAVGMVAVAVLGVIAMATVMASIASWQLTGRAEKAEREALAEAGAQSYLGFHMQRVNGLLKSDEARRGLMAASEEHRDALRRWNILAGEVEVDWVIRNRDLIERAAHVRSELSRPHFDATSTDHHDEITALAQSLMSRLSELRTIGKGRERFPALLDDPFDSVDEQLLPTLLELIVRASQHQQIILLTNNPRISAWARLESMTADMTLVEPTGHDLPMSTSTALAILP